MKNLFRLLIPLILLFNLSCSTINVAVDFDKNNDFSTYKTYKWIKQKKLNDFEIIYKNAINKKRFAISIEN
jgi:hypothetical protein